MDDFNLSQEVKTIPFVQQHDTMECGVACLAMLCGYFGRNYSLSFLSDFCRPTKEGVSLHGISQAAAKLGLNSECIRLDNKELRQITSPCILHWDQNHFVVLSKIKKNKYHILDPGKCPLSLDEEEFQRHWGSNSQGCGIALILEPNEKFDKTENVKEIGQSFDFFWKYLKKYQAYFFRVIICLLFACGFQLIFPFLTRAIVDVGISRSDTNIILLILLGEFMIIMGKTLTDFIQNWLLLHISMRINISLISDFFIKLLDLPMNYFDTRMMGDLLQRMNDHSRVQSFLTSQTLSIFFSFVSLVVFGLVLWIYSIPVFTIFSIGSILYGYWTYLFLSKRKILDYEIFDVQSANQNKTIQLVGCMQEIKLHNCERKRRWEWENTQVDIFNVQIKALKLQQMQQAGAIFLNEMKNISITAMAAFSVINNEMTLGTMLAIQYIIGQMNSPIDKIMAFANSLQDALLSVERIKEVHNTENEDTPTKVNPIFGRGSDIVFDNVSLKYDIFSDQIILSNLNFIIPSNKVTAIVGASGSGKTTLIKLILGFYKSTVGKIEIDGLSIDKYNLREWRKRCGVVMQDSIIFSDTIANNIAATDDDIDEDKLEFAAKMACIDTFIACLPHKYETKIGRDGIGLSQGQKQRILIARAIYKNPDFIFLDEATNSLDARNERSIVENLNEFFRGRTVIVAAHRLSTVKNADQILVLDSGRIVESGNHDGLIAKRGVYFTLIKNQLELGK